MEIPWDFEVDSLRGHLLLIASEAWGRSVQDIVATSSLGSNQWKPRGKTRRMEQVASIRGKPYRTYVDTINKPPRRATAVKSKVRR